MLEYDSDYINTCDKNRKCPICNQEIFFKDFFIENRKRITEEKRFKLWNDDRISIPCCECFFIIDYIKWHSYKIIPTILGYVIRFKIGFYDYINVPILIDTYQTMKMMGFIEENEIEIIE